MFVLFHTKAVKQYRKPKINIGYIGVHSEKKNYKVIKYIISILLVELILDVISFKSMEKPLK